MTKSTLSMALCALFSSTAFAGDPELSGPLQAIQDRWAEANYRLRDDDRLAASMPPSCSCRQMRRMAIAAA